MPCIQEALQASTTERTSAHVCCTGATLAWSSSKMALKPAQSSTANAGIGLSLLACSSTARKLVTAAHLDKLRAPQVEHELGEQRDVGVQVKAARVVWHVLPKVAGHAYERAVQPPAQQGSAISVHTLKYANRCRCRGGGRRQQPCCHQFRMLPGSACCRCCLRGANTGIAELQRPLTAWHQSPPRTPSSRTPGAL